MKYLLELGISEKDLKNMLEVNSDIKDLTEKKIINLIEILKYINCSDNIIRNIITANPMYLNRSNNDILKLIKKLNSLNIKGLSTTFDSNPWLLNKDAYEIDEFINDKKLEGMNIDDIIDLIDAGMVEW